MSVNKHYKSYAEHLHEGGYQPSHNNYDNVNKIKLTSLAKIMIALLILGVAYALTTLS